MNSLYKTTFFIALLLGSQGANAATIYTNATTGSDITGDGTIGNPYASFHLAYTNASAGDTLALSGTFDWTNADETGDVAVTGYSLVKNLTIIGEGSNVTFIQAASAPNTATSCVFTINHDITFKNLAIRYGYNTNQAENAGGITVLDNTRNNLVNFDNCIISENRIDNGITTNYNFAGGIYLRGNTSYHPNVTLTNCTLNDNSANGKAYGAGALYSLQSNIITINGCTFFNNSGTDGSNFGVGYHNVAGAIGFFRFNTVKVTNSTFTANSAETSGGALLSWYNYTYLTNNTIAGNTVTSASGKGGGVYVVFMQQSPGKLYLQNNIIANNTVNGVGEDLNFNTDSWASSIYDNGGNIIEHYTGSSIVMDSSTNLFGEQSGLNLSGTLEQNGASNGVKTLALTAGSVAIDFGVSTANGVVAVPTYDQRDFVRASTVDAGAYEFGGSGLPVTLVSFAAKLNPTEGVDLNWETVSEKDNDRFEVHRSTNLEQWELIAEVDGAGNSTSSIVYTTEDRNPVNGINYYRLKQIDYDGNYEIFDIISVNVQSDEALWVYPNPAKNYITLSGMKGTTFSITDAMGRSWIEPQVYHEGMLIPVGDLDPGMYVLSIGTQQVKFMKSSE